MTIDTSPIPVAFHTGTVVVSEELTPDTDHMECVNTPRIVVDVRINEYLFAPGEGAHWSFCLDFDQAVRLAHQLLDLAAGRADSDADAEAPP